MQVVRRMQGKQILHFLHIGKTGGSAVKHALAPHSSSSHYVVYLHAHNYRLAHVPKGDKVIFFLRDPISRFISGFYSRKRQGQPRYYFPWTENEKMAFEEFSTPNQLAVALYSPDPGKKMRAQSAMRNIRHVRDSYWNWFGSENYFQSRLSDIFFIGQQERLAEDFEVLRSKVGLPESAHLPSDEVLSHTNPEQIDKTLENDALANLKHWYKDDYRFIALCQEFVKKWGWRE